MMDLDRALSLCPLVAILRGLAAADAAQVGGALVEAGFSLIEVPLNSPDPLQSISILSRTCGDRALIGAGTVMTPSDVDDVRAAGGRLIVMPHCDSVVIEHAKSMGLACIPGVATPTEAFAALRAGADALKAFPAEALSPAVIKAWLAVLPPGTRILPVGGINRDNLQSYWAAGVSGFGLGSSLYKPGDPIDVIRTNAQCLIRAFASISRR